jgi:hypothetical protein
MAQLSNATVSSNGNVKQSAPQDVDIKTQVQLNKERLEKQANFLMNLQKENQAEKSKLQLEVTRERMKISASFRPQINSLETSTAFPNLLKALSEFTGKIGKASKSMINGAFGTGSNYADINDYLETANPILSQCGLSFMVRCLGEREGNLQLEGVLMYGDVDICEWISSYMDVDIKDRNGNITNQSRGSGMTYGRRYLMTSMLNLGANDDDGNATSKDKKVAEAEVKPKSKKNTKGK